jgi:ATP-dependent Clp protease ATP-binding subunit ClpC
LVKKIIVPRKFVFKGRQKEKNTLEAFLLGRTRNNVLLVGDNGVGKTAMIQSLVSDVDNFKVPLSTRFNFLSLDIPRILSNTRSRGDLHAQVLDLLEKLVEMRNVVLVIENFHLILPPYSDMAISLINFLNNSSIRIIGIMDTLDYTKAIDENNFLLKEFNLLKLEELDETTTYDIVSENLKQWYSKVHSDVVVSAVRLSKRYITSKALPGSVLDVIDIASARKRFDVETLYAEKFNSLYKQELSLTVEKNIATANGDMDKAVSLTDKVNVLSKEITKLLTNVKQVLASGDDAYINEDDIRAVIADLTGIPVQTLTADVQDEVLTLRERLGRKIIGQDEAIDAVTRAIKRAKTGIISYKRPWASFLFLGPTGVGKSELASVLNKELFGKEEDLIQIDMSEMMEQHSVSKLIGSPPGYIGFKSGGQLTEAVKRRPHSVILFDEVEKAHADVLNILLQILEYGRLTDGQGNVVDFTSTVIIMTSNIGADEIKTDKVLGFRHVADSDDKVMDSAYESMKRLLLRELKDSLRPELLNRIDDIVIFRTLHDDDLLRIVDVLLDELNERLAERRLRLQVDYEVKKLILNKVDGDEYGARPLRRVIQEYIEGALADYLLVYPNLLRLTRLISLQVSLKNGKVVIKRAR